ncbi:uncharacterized protein LOC126886189 [Diabrotica virgifera virgifera]|uniref:Reverse transcriptase domain-containing protein n=1 Tax=Diabrotica virgifera virgifera TaxID=50390 RepID=A0ABM5KFM2_DIAVI|nr:uncharacterized protein LOC126886189 [Diabrotica virgifera virgifera]
MIHKKGSIDNPSNYRGIALMSCVEKIFTQVLLNRLNEWTDNNNIIPEIQSGFRKHRSCTDNVFVLNSIIQSRLRLKKRKVFVAFVDYNRAFDSVSHNLLWQKLYNIGVSGRIILLLRNIYNEASMQVAASDGFTSQLDISAGVLQGE